jgi:predicted nucleotidyltransferase
VPATEAARLSALAFADGLATRCTDALGDAVLSTILHGSLTLGDFTPHRSDIDLLVIVGNPLSDDELAALRDAVAAAGGDAPRRVDLRLVTRTTAAVPPRRPRMEAEFTFRPGQSIGVETGFAEPDLVPEFSIARAHGRNLVGRPPEAVIGPVPGERVLEVADRQLAAWERLTDDADHAELMVLSACRIWRFAVEGVHCSKAAAARWALEREPAIGVVEDALRQRTVDPAVSIGSESVGRVLAHVRRELRRGAPRYPEAPS